MLFSTIDANLFGRFMEVAISPSMASSASAIMSIEVTAEPDTFRMDPPDVVVIASVSCARLC